MASNPDACPGQGSEWVTRGHERVDDPLGGPGVAGLGSRGGGCRRGSLSASGEETSTKKRPDA